MTGDGRDGGVYDLGRGVGVSVKELLAAVRDTTGHPFEPDIAPRRDGDPPLVIAKVAAIEQALAWRPRLSLTDMIDSAWSG